MARKARRIGWRTRALGLLLLAALAGGAWLWWDLRHWRPDETAFPDQGAEVSASEGAVRFRTLRALGASFVYLDASDGASERDARFGNNLADARAAGLQVGAVHRFDPCTMADGQSANFVTMVPRDPALLPPAIELSRTAEACAERVGDAAVESELMTLINQIEMHAGKPVILKIDPGFEERYHLAGMLERHLWLTRTRFAPEYAGRPWLLWTANTSLQTEAAEAPLRWVVVQP
ncbi:glycoside hydrolase family 25 protein [Pelagerythrobacter rhizovicinus]|uniref:Lysozyme n=1 Tax=Pelagerythrobacter rhizovicinus TaxID=2268576 RepID=A0A4Q2KM72_9SPHN|nr:glycoside hydrolase family 25 protein [Pelagerythrobacter rhizovicinus]RXZ64483.1 lysozyme [Pelagerythrobacter rhizovicinus]